MSRWCFTSACRCIVIVAFHFLFSALTSSLVSVLHSIMAKRAVKCTWLLFVCLKVSTVAMETNISVLHFRLVCLCQVVWLCYDLRSGLNYASCICLLRLTQTQCIKTQTVLLGGLATVVLHCQRFLVKFQWGTQLIVPNTYGLWNFATWEMLALTVTV